MFSIFKKRKVQFVILVIVVLIVGFAIFGDREVKGELYPTSTQGLEVAKASEIIELKNSLEGKISLTNE